MPFFAMRLVFIYPYRQQSHNQLYMEKELLLRIEKIRKQLAKVGVEACLISTPVNLLYSAGRVIGGYHYISQSGKPLLFVRRPVGLSGDNIIYIRKPEDIPGLLLDNGFNLPETIMIEGGEMSYTDWMRLQACFPKSKFHDGTTDLRYVRSIKTDWELAQLRKSAEAHVRAYSRIPEVFRAGMTDIEFSIEIERIMRLEGCKGLFRTFGNMEAFMGSILTGDNASANSPYDFALGGAGDPTNPIGANGSVLLPGKSVMVDMGGNFTGYLDDVTRTYSIGKLSEKAYKAHQVAIEIEDLVQEAMKEGAVCEEVYDIAVKKASLEGLADCFMGTTQQAKFVGHGVGLVINEPPVLALRSKEILLPGMVLAVEPKFVIEGVGAVGIEDTFIVGKNGSEKISILESGIIDIT